MAVILVTAATIVVATGLLELDRSGGKATSANPTQEPVANSSGSPTPPISPSQLNSIKIAMVGSYLFPVERETVGGISFADDLSVQVYPSYQGKVFLSNMLEASSAD